MYSYGNSIDRICALFYSEKAFLKHTYQNSINHIRIESSSLFMLQLITKKSLRRKFKLFYYCILSLFPSYGFMFSLLGNSKFEIRKFNSLFDTLSSLKYREGLFKWSFIQLLLRVHSIYISILFELYRSIDRF